MGSKSLEDRVAHLEDMLTMMFEALVQVEESLGSEDMAGASAALGGLRASIDMYVDNTS